jgi:hypothetical protein
MVCGYYFGSIFLEALRSFGKAYLFLEEEL